MNHSRSIYFAALFLLITFVTVTRAQQPDATAIPEDARRYFVQANTLFKTAQSKDDYTQAAALYQQALQVAPHFGNAWYNLSKAQEKLQQYDDAIASIKHFLADSPSDPEARTAQDHEYELEALKNKNAKFAESPEGKAKALQDRFAGYKVVKVWTCRIVTNNGQKYCTDQEALGSHWDGDWASPPPGQSWPVQFTVTGPNNDIISLTLYGDRPVGGYCAPASSIQSSESYWPLVWKKCPNPQYDFPENPVFLINLDSDWKGSKAIYTEECAFRDFSICTREGQHSRNYWLLSK
jgi:hypothetical protein